MELKPWHTAILQFLAQNIDPMSGFTVQYIAVAYWGDSSNRFSSSAAATSSLKVMEKAGLVRRLDDRKPIIWAITDAGRAALQPDTKGAE